MQIILNNKSLNSINAIELKINGLSKKTKEINKVKKDLTLVQYTATIHSTLTMGARDIANVTVKQEYKDSLLNNGMSDRKAKRLVTLAFHKKPRAVFTKTDTTETISKFLVDNKLTSVRTIEAYFMGSDSKLSKVQKMYKDFQEFESNEQLEIADLIKTFIRVHNLAIDLEHQVVEVA